MKGIDSTGAHLVHVPGWMDEWVGGWVDGSKSRFKDCLQQSKILFDRDHKISFKYSMQLNILEERSAHTSAFLGTLKGIG